MARAENGDCRQSRRHSGGVRGTVDPDRQTGHDHGPGAGQRVTDPTGDLTSGLARPPRTDHRDRAWRGQRRRRAAHEEHHRRLVDGAQTRRIVRIIQGDERETGVSPSCEPVPGRASGQVQPLQQPSRDLPPVRCGPVLVELPEGTGRSVLKHPSPGPGGGEFQHVDRASLFGQQAAERGRPKAADRGQHRPGFTLINHRSACPSSAQQPRGQSESRRLLKVTGQDRLLSFDIRDRPGHPEQPLHATGRQPH